MLTFNVRKDSYFCLTFRCIANWTNTQIFIIGLLCTVCCYINMEKNFLSLKISQNIIVLSHHLTEPPLGSIQLPTSYLTSTGTLSSFSFLLISSHISCFLFFKKSSASGRKRVICKCGFLSGTCLDILCRFDESWSNLTCDLKSSGLSSGIMKPSRMAVSLQQM